MKGRARPGPDVRRTTRDNAAGPGGMPCPECGGVIEMTLDGLLRSRTFACRTPGCGTVLRLDRARSTAALNGLQVLKLKLDEISRRD